MSENLHIPKVFLQRVLYLFRFAKGLLKLPVCAGKAWDHSLEFLSILRFYIKAALIGTAEEVPEGATVAWFQVPELFCNYFVLALE